jgi:transcriptional regulator with XRE-family HTH domain
MIPGEALADIADVKILQVARKMSGLTLADIAAGVGRDEATVGGWFAGGSDCWPPATLLPRLCQVLDDPLLIEWLYAQYHRLCEGAPVPDFGTDPGRVRDLLVRGVSQVSHALNLAKDFGPSPSRSQSRRLSEAILLAAATLAAAAREARGRSRAPGRQLAFLHAAEAGALAVPEVAGWWRRLTDWLGGWARYRALRAQLARTAAAQAEERARDRERLAEVQRIMGAMGHELLLAVCAQGGRRNVVQRLLDDGKRFGGEYGCTATGRSWSPGAGLAV